MSNLFWPGQMSDFMEGTFEPPTEAETSSLEIVQTWGAKPNLRYKKGEHEAPL